MTDEDHVRDAAALGDVTGDGGIELAVADAATPADLRLADCASLEDFEDELGALLRPSASRAGHVAIALHAGPAAPITVPEAMEALVKAHAACAAAPTVLCLFASDRAKRSAERVLPGLVRPTRVSMFGALQVSVVQGNIVSIDADAIVNASNIRLALGAGVSGAIKKAVARPEALQAEMTARGPIQPGEVVATAAHGLGSVRFILHAATASGDERVVRRAYGEVLELAERMQLVSIAVPALGCGTGGLALEKSAALLRSAVEARTEWRSLRKLVVVLYDGEAADVFAAVLSATA